VRAQAAEMGAPEGFTEVVAQIEPIADDDTAAHWSVTFAVDDVDAFAAQARELGGTVLTEPADVPWCRQSLIADPNGATFVASQFVPENAGLTK
jgi:predicted enzyme related to lactoylglutathione lyase